MGEFCVLILTVLMVPAQVTNRLISWALDNVAKFREWFEPLPDLAKRGLYAGVCFGIGIGLFYAGRALSCPDLPEWGAFLYALLQAVIGYFQGGKRHEKQKREVAEAEVEKLRRYQKHGR